MAGTFNPDLTSYKIVKYPTATAIGTMASGASANTYTGTYTEVVAASAIATDFYLCGIVVNNADCAQDTAIKVGVGAAASEVDIFEFGIPSNSSTANVFTGYSIPIDPIKIAANSRVAIDVYDSEAAANNVNYALLFKTEQ